jgi:hypothetical protein
MRHLLALSAVLVLAGACLAAEFKSDEAKKAQADYVAARDAAKTAYGQGLAKAKATIDAKAAAATDAISKEAIQSESAAITEELVRLRDANAAAFEPREWKSAETKKVAVAYAAELKAAQMKHAQDLTKARQVLLARKAAATESAAKEALQAEIALIEEEQARLKEDVKSGSVTKLKADGEGALKGKTQLTAQECAELAKKYKDGSLTETLWQSIRGKVVEVDIRKEASTKLVLAEGQRIMILPHPGDKWGNDPQDPGKPAERYGAEGSGKRGPYSHELILNHHGKGADYIREMGWTGITQMDNYIWGIPGEVVMKCCVNLGARGRIWKGAIRVKIIPVVSP